MKAPREKRQIGSRRRHRFGERDAIQLLEDTFCGEHRREVAVGIGDDAAVLALDRRRLVWTVDTNVEGVHFRRDWLAWGDIGWRSLQAAASDLAAMGARPLAALSSLILPESIGRRELAALGRGQARAAREIGCPIVGGNISRGSELSVTSSLLGEAAEPLVRSNARSGDEVWLIGDLGLAAAGLELLRSGQTRRVRGSVASTQAVQRCVAAWRRPRALISRGLALVGRARAVIDVSDGLSGDAAELARASKVRVVVEASAVESALSPALRRAAAILGRDPVELALAGGEDYALLATGPRSARPVWASRIGRVERGAGAVLRRAGARALQPLGPGFDHLA